VDGETRVDRVRRRVADHKLGALVLLAVAVIGGIGGTIGGVREIVDLFDSESDSAPRKNKPGPVRFDPSELRTARNFRYAFSFQYPVTWERQDPPNGDGLAAIGPLPGLQLGAYGALPTFGPSPNDAFERLEYRARELSEGARVVEGPSQQNIPQSAPSGETFEVAGSRLVMETDAGRPRAGTFPPDAADEAPALTTVALVATTPDRDLTMECQVPTRIYPRWRGACNQFLSTLTLTR
jgi:hypothetical protein